jgi:hypothetical protein
MQVQDNKVADLSRFHFVVAASQEAVLQRCLLASPIWQHGARPPTVVWNAGSAAAAFNPVMEKLEAQHRGALRNHDAWVVWVHQDVRLPSTWAAQWCEQLQSAQQRWPTMAVAGVYGLMETGVAGAAQRAGHVMDRGAVLREPAALPHEATSLDELLVAVRVGSGLRFDDTLGFDFYGTDICLQAQGLGLQCAVLDACCEHHSTTPRSGVMPRRLVDRIRRNGERFERKWAHRLPLSTSCFDIRQCGDVGAFLNAHTTPQDEV